ncbi:hypothetical protein D3C79_1105250 [compost metagenome]
MLSKIAAALQIPLEQIVHVISDQQQTANPSSQEGYADKIAHQIIGLSLKEQEAVYKFVKQLVQFKDID